MMEFFRHNTRSLTLLAILLFFGFSSWFIKLSDLDFWWHIKTGQYILEHKGLPDKDPFTFTFMEQDRDIPERPGVILKSYWLSQIVLYLTYKHTGPLGIILFKSFIFALILVMLWKYLLDNSASQILTVIMLIGFIFFSKEYMLERPQIFSFLFATVVFYLLEDIKKAYSGQRIAYSEKQATSYTLHAARYTLLPLVMLLWANMHGGYLVGIAFIIVYAASLLIKKDPLKSKAPILILYITSILITLLNPVTYHPITSFISFKGSLLERETLEFISPLKVIRYLNVNWYPYFGLLILSMVTIFINIISIFKKRADTLPPEHIILLIGTSLASLSSLRYGMFFMIVAIPIITVYLSRRVRLSIPAGFKKGIIIALSAILFILFFRSPLFEQSRDKLIEPTFVPVNATEFIKQRAPQSNIYNDINWGGYLIWKLYPDYKVFSDTRTLNLEIYRQYLSILNANETMYLGIPEWKALLDMYSINTVVHSTVNPYSGEIFPLMLKLMKDDSWHLVYIDGVAAILVRKMSPNFFEFPKDYLLREMYWEVTRGLERFPNHPGFLKTLNRLNTMK